MPIPFKCPHCGVTGNSPDKYAGRIAHCPKCNGQVEIATLDWATPPPPPPTSPPTVAVAPSVAVPEVHKGRFPRHYWPPILLVGGILIVLSAFILPFFDITGPSIYYVLLTLLGIGAFTAVLLPPAVAFWQKRTPKRGSVPPHHVTAAIEWTALLVAGLVFMESRHQDTSGIPWTNRIALAVLLWAILSKVARRTYGRKTWRVLLPLMLVTIFVWSRYDYREHTWTNENDPESQQWDYTDHQYRNAEHPFFRRMHRWGGKDSIYFSMSMSGPMSESGKPHGQWKTSNSYSTDYAKEVGKWNEGHETWYWYGEEISEGEWHLRNK